MKDSKVFPQGGARAWFVWGLATLFVVFLFNLQTGYEIINNDLKTDIGLTVAQIGLIAAIYTWVFALAQLFAGSILDKLGVAVRTGHHCAQPIMNFYCIPGTVRASFAFYNTKEEIDVLVAAVKRAHMMLS